MSYHKRIAFAIVFVFLAAFFILTINSHRSPSKVSDEPDLPDQLEAVLQEEDTVMDFVWKDGTVYALVHRDGEAEDADIFTVFDQEPDGKWRRSYENDFAGIKPWKIGIADIDGNGEEEILIAVKKTAYFDQVEKNRMFIFNYTDGILAKKWTGSQIAGSWRDFYTADLVSASGCELIFIEQTEDGLEKIKVYHWFDFGFFLLAESDTYPYIKNLTIPGYNRIEITVQDGQTEETIVLTAKDGKLTKN